MSFTVSVRHLIPPLIMAICVFKGRFGLDFTTHPRRLKTPLIRNGGPGEFREGDWG